MSVTAPAAQTPGLAFGFPYTLTVVLRALRSSSVGCRRLVSFQLVPGVEQRLPTSSTFLNEVIIWCRPENNPIRSISIHIPILLMTN